MEFGSSGGMSASVGSRMCEGSRGSVRTGISEGIGVSIGDKVGDDVGISVVSITVVAVGSVEPVYDDNAPTIATKIQINVNSIPAIAMNTIGDLRFFFQSFQLGVQSLLLATHAQKNGL